MSAGEDGAGGTGWSTLAAAAAGALVGAVLGAGVARTALQRGKGDDGAQGNLRGAVLTKQASRLEARPEADMRDVEGRQGFCRVFGDLCEELVQDLEHYDLGEVSGQPLRRMLEYNVPGGKLNRGLTVVHTALAIFDDAARRGASDAKAAEGARAKLAKRAGVLGWAIEWLQASFLVSDDVMDASITRRGQPCWYKNADVGMIAINDALVLMTHVDVLLHKYFGDDPQLFVTLHRLFTETTYQTEMGQFLDLSTQPPQGPINLDLYTEERYLAIVTYKTAFYSFYAPVALGMIAAGVGDTESLKVARSICIEMGVYFQIQDDFLDVYGTPEVIGKIGTDIEDAKCSWLVVKALQRASPDQRALLLEHYGKRGAPASVKIVKQVFSDLNLEQVYHDYEEAVYRRLVDRIQATVHSVPRDVFLRLLHKIHRRVK